MAKMDDAIKRWADNATAKGEMPATVVFDPCSNPGEGEVKIFKLLQQEVQTQRKMRAAEPGEPGEPGVAKAGGGGECTVVGGDSDLLLLSLVSCSTCTIRVATAGKSKAGDNSFKFSCDLFATKMTSGGQFSAT